MPTADRICLELSNDEALVLFEFLTRFGKADRSSLFEDQAEERVLWNLEALLERELIEPFEPDYERCLREARDRVRDRE